MSIGDRYRIVKVQKRNFDDFLFLVDKLAEYEKLVAPDNKARRRLKKDAFLKNPLYEAYIGFLGKRPIAYLILLYTYSSFKALPTLFIEDIFVLQEYRRKRYGQKLFDFCLKKALKRRCGRVEFIVLNWNINAQKFYKKNRVKKMDWLFYRREL